MIRSLTVSIWLAAALLGQSPESAPPIASNPVEEVSGVIAEVHISQGQGMPYVVVKRGSESSRVYLGAMHYLIAQNFSPKTGQSLTAKGYKVGDGIVGIVVTLPAEKRTVRLRDDKGWPLWRGMMGRHRMEGKSAP